MEVSPTSSTSWSEGASGAGEEQRTLRKMLHQDGRTSARRDSEEPGLTGGLRGRQDEVVFPGVRHLVHVDGVFPSRQELVDVD